MATRRRSFGTKPQPLHLGRLFILVAFFVLPISFITASPMPSIRSKHNQIAHRAEINPVARKFRTVADSDMPGYPDFSVTSKFILSTWNDDELSLTTTQFMPGIWLVRAPIANGYIGTAVAAAGPFFEKDINQTNHALPNSNDLTVKEGWPLWNDRQTFSTVSGFHDCQDTTPGYNYKELRDRGCESVISGIPYPMGLHLAVGDQILNSTVDKDSISNFSQTMNFRNGVPSWSYTWSPNDTQVSFDIEYEVFMSRVRPNIGGTRLRVTPRGGNYNASIIDLLDGRSAVRSSLGKKGMYPDMCSIYVSNHPDGLPNVTAWTISSTNVSNGYMDESTRRLATNTGSDSSMSIGQEWDVRLAEGETATFEKLVGIASTDKFQDPESTVRFELARASSDGWDTILSEHTEAWNKLMEDNQMTNYRDPATGHLPENDTIIEKFQAMAAGDHFYLMQNLLLDNGNGLNDNGVSVGGLTSDTYGGMLFWDQEAFMFPGIARVRPDYGLQFLLVRTKDYRQALQNAQEDYVQAKYKFDNKSVLFSWVRGRFGNATATGPVLDYEYHINLDIALDMWEWGQTSGNNEFFKENFWDVFEGVAHTMTTLLVKDRAGWSIRNMTDPDEYANNVNNGAFTLTAISEVLDKTIRLQREYGIPVNETWVDMANNLNIPLAASGITREYEGMLNNVTVKQADVLLITSHLSSKNYSLDTARKDVDYYTQKQTPDGPAMTYDIAAIDENQVAKSGCAAFTFDMQARLPYIRAPWYQFSEQARDDSNENGGVNPALPFLTGHGGAHQATIFGYLGLKRGKEDLTIRPSLPPPFKHMTTPNFYSHGSRFNATMNATHTTITRLPVQDVTGMVDRYPSASMPLIVERRSTTEGIIEETRFMIAMNETVTVENDMYWEQLSTPNNILQCQSTTSNAESALGQYAGAATDGNAGTRWQPYTLNAANLTVDTSGVPYQQVEKLVFDWGRRPPKIVRVGLTNETDLASIKDAKYFFEMKPEPSQIYIAPEFDTEVVSYVGNRTTFDIPANTPTWSGKFAILEIEGCNGCDWVDSPMLSKEKFPGEQHGMGATVGEFEIIGMEGKTDIVKETEKRD